MTTILKCVNGRCASQFAVWSIQEEVIPVLMKGILPLWIKSIHTRRNLNLIWARSILISQQSLQLSERHQFMGGNTFTQYLQAHSSPFPSIANSFLTTSGLQSVGITTIACQILALQHGQWPLHNELLFTTTETQLSAAALTSCDNYRQNISSSTYIR